jgi:hypothetical protein
MAAFVRIQLSRPKRTLPLNATGDAVRWNLVDLQQLSLESLRNDAGLEERLDESSQGLVRELLNASRALFGENFKRASQFMSGQQGLHQPLVLLNAKEIASQQTLHIALKLPPLVYVRHVVPDSKEGGSADTRRWPQSVDASHSASGTC